MGVEGLFERLGRPRLAELLPFVSVWVYQLQFQRFCEFSHDSSPTDTDWSSWRAHQRTVELGRI